MNAEKNLAVLAPRSVYLAIHIVRWGGEKSERDRAQRIVNRSRGRRRKRGMERKGERDRLGGEDKGMRDGGTTKE